MLYLIENVTTGTIKIGISKNPTERLKQLQTGNANKLQLIKVYDVEEDHHWEKRLHKMFWQNRLKGEWFKLIPLQDYLLLIDSLLKKNYL